MLKVLSLLKPYRLRMAGALFCMLIELAVELLQPLLMAEIIDQGILKKNLHVVLMWGGIMLAIALLAFLAGITNSFLASSVSQGYGYDLREHLFNKVQTFSFANVNRYSSSSLITRMTNDVTQMQNMMFMSLRVALRAPLLIIGGVVMSFIVDSKLAFILSLSVPLLLIFLRIVLTRAGKLFKMVQEKLDQVNSVMRENLSGMRLIKAFLRRDYEIQRFDKASIDLKKKTQASLRLIETTIPVLLLVMNIVIMAVLWAGSQETHLGTAKAGEVVAVINYSTRITSVLSILSFIIMAFSRGKASGTRIGDVLGTEVDLTDTEAAKPLDTIEGSIRFQEVSFHYPDHDRLVLDNLSFTIRAGETVALMGATGSGKSSFFQLIPRLYDPTKGNVFIDGRDVRTMKLEELRKQIGFVPQEALLFTGSITDNLKWGKEDATPEELREAASHAQIHETIMRLPNGYETRVGQRGVNLSGGQKQRLSIARALIRKPKILLLDDSTSALDLKTEAKLLQALSGYACTTFIITQKISTARAADRIFLMDDGKLLAEGRHEELLNKSALYAQIVQSQSGEEASHVRSQSTSS